MAAFEEEEFYRLPLEAVAAEAGRRARGHFNLIHRGTAYRADLYLAGHALCTVGPCRGAFASRRAAARSGSRRRSM